MTKSVEMRSDSVTKHRQLARLERSLGYQFKNLELLETALTHRSLGSHNNERFEFLGDSILNFAIAECLFRLFPAASEGELSRLRAALVRGEMLAEIARELQLGDYLNLGEGELKSGGHRRASILADAVEAIIGAIYLESGVDTAKHCLLGWFGSRLDSVSLTRTEKDPKTELQEWLQGRKLPLPNYQVLATDGEQHSQYFSVRCSVPDTLAEPTQARAPSRKAAEKDAATQMLAKLEQLYAK